VGVVVVVVVVVVVNEQQPQAILSLSDSLSPRPIGRLFAMGE